MADIQTSPAMPAAQSVLERSNALIRAIQEAVARADHLGNLVAGLPPAPRDFAGPGKTETPMPQDITDSMSHLESLVSNLHSALNRLI